MRSLLFSALLYSSVTFSAVSEEGLGLLMDSISAGWCKSESIYNDSEISTVVKGVYNSGSEGKTIILTIQKHSPIMAIYKLTRESQRGKIFSEYSKFKELSDAQKITVCGKILDKHSPDFY